MTDGLFQLRFLEFETQASDDPHPTWEAVASVRPELRQDLATELRRLLTALPRWLGSLPMPLDDGGHWDLWLQVQWDGHPPMTLTPEPGGAGWAIWHEEGMGTDQAPSPWLTLTVTLVAEAALAAEVERRLGL